MKKKKLSTEKVKSTSKPRYLKLKLTDTLVTFYEHSNRVLHKSAKIVAEQVRYTCSDEEINLYFGTWIYNSSQLQHEWHIDNSRNQQSRAKRDNNNTLWKERECI